ncbi:uncharacterized protein LOC121856018 [Homarus americanus]|nr:uncharacterized protein LOC121856018 [Homarus americanus]
MSDVNESETRALLWCITGGIVLVLCVMATITCLLLRYNRTMKAPRGKRVRVRSSRGDGHRLNTPGYNKAAKKEELLYLQPRQHHPLPIAPGKMAPDLPMGHHSHSQDEHYTPASSVENHIYDEPELKVPDNTQHDYYNASETSGSVEYETIDYCIP